MAAKDFYELAIEESPRPENAGSGTPYRVSTDVLYIPVRAGNLTPAPSMLDRSDELRGLLGSPALLRDTFDPSGSISERAYFKDLIYLLAIAGFDYAVANGDGTNEVQTLTISGSPTGGTFNMTFGGETTAEVVWNATPAQVQAALEALPGLIPGDVVCAGTAMPAGSITVTFEGRKAGQNVGDITTADSLTPSGTSSFANTTPGAAGTITDPDGNGMAAGARRWTFTKRDAIQARTAQIRKNLKDESVLLVGQGYGCTQLSLNAAGELTAQLLGMVLTRQALDTTTTPAYAAATVEPARRGDLTLTWLSGGANVEDFDLAIANSLAPVPAFDQDPPSDFYSDMELGDEQVAVTGNIPKRTIGATDYDALINATAFAAMARWLSRNSKVGSTGKPYGLWVDMPGCQYTGGSPGDLSNTRRVPATFSFGAQVDEGSGYDVQITVVNGESAIETFV